MASTNTPTLPQARTRTGVPALALAVTPWRSPEGQPAYARPALLGILVLAAVLFTWDIQHATYHPFYSETVRSMSQSWKGFFYGSFDPGNSITMDKAPGFMWPQALSVRVFGFHAWALTLPQVIEGVLSVAVLHRAVLRWAGPKAALLAAATFIATPTIAGLFRTEVEDPLFTLLMLLAGNATLKAAREGRLRSLMAAGMWVGFGVQAKMLEAWAVLPALGLVYLLAAPPTLRRRLAHLAVAGAVCLAVSASWVLMVTATPAKDRPFVDGTTDNSAISQVVGYNFLNRFASLGISAKQTGSVDSSAMAGTPPSPNEHKSQSPKEWAKMFGKSLASQTGWLYPAAALSAVCGIVWRRRKPRTDPIRAGFVMWGAWFVTFFMVFSAGSVGAHIYYMGIVAAPMAALFGGGMVQFWRAWKSGGRVRSWALPVVLTSTVVWEAFTAAWFSYLSWLVPATIVLGAAAGGLLVLSRISRTGGTRLRQRLAVLGIGVAITAMLLPSAAWASSVLNPMYGHAGTGAAGPIRSHPAKKRTAKPVTHVTPTPARTASAAGTGKSKKHLDKKQLAAEKKLLAEKKQLASEAAAIAAMPVTGFGFPRALSPLQLSLLDYTRAHQDGARYLFAVTSWRVASPYILFQGAAVLPMGGFTGSAPSPTLPELQSLVATGQLRYVMLGGPSTAAGHASAGWVRTHCTRDDPRFPQFYLCTPSSVTNGGN
jgi:4-amino-4-deoxy-L-arabinose transferase-like glycosyltransferase